MKSVAALPLNIPDGLIEEILLSLPVKSLLRFKCVCKSWLSLISNPEFVKSHFDLAAAPTHRLLNLINDTEFRSIDTDAAFCNNSREVVFNNLLPPLCYQFIVGSCRGFILLETDVCYYKFIDFVIWNPSTGFIKQIKPISYGPDMSSPLCGIWYDSSTDDYVVVAVTMVPRRYMVVNYFSIRTNSWSFSESTVPYYSSNPHFRYGVAFDGALHWLINSYEHCHRVIIAFDAREKRLLEIPVPQHLAVRSNYQIYHLSVMSECLCICVEMGKVFEIWMMKEYKVQSSWTKLFVLSTISYPRVVVSYPICFTKNGEILVTDGVGILARLNDRAELLEQRKYKQHWDKFGLLFWCTYRESLLSLPEDSEKPIADDQHQ